MVSEFALTQPFERAHPRFQSHSLPLYRETEVQQELTIFLISLVQLGGWIDFGMACKFQRRICRTPPAWSCLTILMRGFHSVATKTIGNLHAILPHGSKAGWIMTPVWVLLMSSRLLLVMISSFSSSLECNLCGVLHSINSFLKTVVTRRLLCAGGPCLA